VTPAGQGAQCAREGVCGSRLGAMQAAAGEDGGPERWGGCAPMLGHTATRPGKRCGHHGANRGPNVLAPRFPAMYESAIVTTVPTEFPGGSMTIAMPTLRQKPSDTKSKEAGAPSGGLCLRCVSLSTPCDPPPLLPHSTTAIH
jgi:hypothetical protein